MRSKLRPHPPRTDIYMVGQIDQFNWQSRPLRPVDKATNLPLEKITHAQSLKQAGHETAPTSYRALYPQENVQLPANQSTGCGPAIGADPSWAAAAAEIYTPIPNAWKP